jgi:hypothetical protein
MIEMVTAVGQPMLYITTQTSDRASSIASTIKLSLDQVSRYLDAMGTGPVDKPIAIFADWNGRLVTIEAGYPVREEALRHAGGRFQAGRTPAGPAAHFFGLSASADPARRNDALMHELRKAGLLTNGTTWEVFRDGRPGEEPASDLYAQLLDQDLVSPPT